MAKKRARKRKRARKPPTTSMRIPADAARLARKCAANAEMTTPDWIGDVIRQAAAERYPEVVDRDRRDRH